jgi:hypothetical protein
MLGSICEKMATQKSAPWGGRFFASDSTTTENDASTCNSMCALSKNYSTAVRNDSWDNAHTFDSSNRCRNSSFGLTTKGKGLARLRAKRKSGSQNKEAARVRTKRKPRSHITYSRECKKVWGSVREWTLKLPKQLPFWEMESRRTPKTSKSDFKGQSSMACGVLYIIGKLLKHKCLKWARIAHLDIWNTSYSQKKGRESNCQFNPQPEKVGNRPDLLVFRGRATYHWKALDESYNFSLDHISIRVLLTKLWGSKVAGVPIGGISRLPLESPEREKPFGCRLCGQSQSIL